MTVPESKLHILLIEDDETDREAVHRLVGRQYCLIDASTGRQGLEVFGSTPVDCVLLDYRLPDMDGMDLLEELSKRRIPVIMFTGAGDHQVDLKAMEIGAADYLVKGKIDRALLERSIRYAIAHGKAEEAQREADRLKGAVQAAGAAAHNINQPLQVIMGGMELLQPGMAADDPGQRQIDAALKAVEKISTIVEQMLSIRHYATIPYASQVNIIDFDSASKDAAGDS